MAAAGGELSQHRLHGVGGDGDAEHRAGLRQTLLPEGMDRPGQSDAAHQLDQRLKHLGESGGYHVALPLIVSPVDRDHTAAEDGRCNGQHRRHRPGIAGQLGKLPPKQEDGPAAQQPGAAHDAQRRPKSAPGIGIAAGGDRLGHHLGDRHRDPGDGQRPHRVEEVVSGHKVAHAGAADDIGQRYLEEGPDELDDKGGRRQHQRPLQDVLAPVAPLFQCPHLLSLYSMAGRPGSFRRKTARRGNGRPFRLLENSPHFSSPEMLSSGSAT